MDGFSCISRNSTQIIDICPSCKLPPIENKLCSENSFPIDLDIQGNQIESRVCVQCNLSSSLQIGNKCKSCLPYVYLEDAEVDVSSVDCSKLTNINGFLFEKELIDDQPNKFKAKFGENVIESELFKKYGAFAYRTCKLENNRNMTSCQLLANLCVLNLYKKDDLSETDLCNSFELLNSNFNAKKTLPWITYSESYQDYTKKYATNGILNNLEGDKYLKIKLDSNELAFYAAEYSLFGKLIDFREIDFNSLNLCNTINTSPFLISNIDIKCSIKIDRLFEMSNKAEQLFFDIYLKYGNGSNLFPIPVKVNDEKNSINSEQIHRRFFILESKSGRKLNSAKQLADENYVRYAKSVTFSFELLEGGSYGEIYPPIVSIVYDYAKQTDAAKSVEVNFKVEYKMNMSAYRTPVYIIIGVFSGFAFIWSTIRIWNWNRRAGRYGIDCLFLFKYLMFLVGSFSNVIQIGILIASVYFLIFYRYKIFNNVTLILVIFC